MNDRDDDRDRDDRRLMCGLIAGSRGQRVRTGPRPSHADPQRQQHRAQKDHQTKSQQIQQQHQQRQQQQHQERTAGGHWPWQRRRCAETADTQPPPSLAAECRVLDRKPEMVVLPDDRALVPALAADGYRLGGTVGYGSYSKVYVAVRMTADKGRVRRLACKKIDKRRVAGGGGRGGGTGAASAYVRKFLPRELDVLRAVRHPNVVRTHRIYETPASVLVFMDYCELGDLLQHLQRAKTVPQWQAHMFFKQICDAVDYLHRNCISHRDIKCENVLLETERHVKLADFGFARMCVDERGRPIVSQTYCGSSLYAAPEVLQGIPYDPKASDVWALGVVLYVMLADCMPYTQSNRQQIVANQINRKLNTPKKFMCREAQKLLAMILEPDVTKRATVYQVRRHQWVCQPNQYTLTH